mmetsp:Transcript_29644/g.88610  ORF Transcript_29644/g.88610 Transcript_29644/m.88610 type:complete len:204 (+) Transcript_29644:279-890(+)
MRAALFAAAAAALQHGAAPLRAPLAPLRVTQGEAPIASPFENNAPAAGAAASVEFSMANVDAVLDDVRPYLIQDGGEVTVLEADPATKNVVLRLEGACGSCPSSTTTMKMGIERVLKERWPDIGSVTRDTDPENQTLDVAAVEKLLGPIGTAVSKLGGTLTVSSAGEAGPGVVELLYAGPDNVRYGVELSLLDSPLVTEVRWL